MKMFGKKKLLKKMREIEDCLQSEINAEREISLIYSMFYRCVNYIKNSTKENEGKLLLYGMIACKYPHVFNPDFISRHKSLLVEIINDLEDLAKTLEIPTDEKKHLLTLLE